jgi:hypothetical protein
VSAPVLQRMVISFSEEAVTVRALYRREHGPNPGTRQRAREVGQLVQAGLNGVIVALQDDELVVVGEAGFEVREDVIAVERK